MASRPVFFVNKDNEVKVINTEFIWYSGFALSQKQKSIQSLHDNFSILKNIPTSLILEVSSKSKNNIGNQLSAFNLKYDYNGKFVPVECIFQGSKEFRYGGPYNELYYSSPLDAKKDSRLKESGNLVSFRLDEITFPLEPKTLFYNWVYMKALHKKKKLVERIIEYNAFTDIMFNPTKSINSQAHAVATYLSLYRKNIIDDILRDVNSYLNYFKVDNYKYLSLFD